MGGKHTSSASASSLVDQLDSWRPDPELGVLVCPCCSSTLEVQASLNEGRSTYSGTNSMAGLALF